MDGTTARSGIGRRRGAAANSKSPSTSLVVLMITFILASCVILISLMCWSMKSSTTPREFSPDKASSALSLNTRKRSGSNRNDKRIITTKEDLEIIGRGTPPRRKVGGGGNDKDKLAMIVNAEMDLVAIDTDGIESTNSEDGAKYRGVRAYFCKLHWDKYKRDPPSLPMFRMLVEESGCNRKENLFAVDLAEIARKLGDRETVEELMGVKVMPPAGFIFHESRVGSTLVANALTAMDPEGHRVYSESDPINRALSACDGFTKCNMETNVNLVRDVVFLMGRTSNPNEKRMFFKVSSIGSKRIDVMGHAFEYVPWLYVFRDPVQTMMSHMDPAKLGKKAVRGGLPPAVCLRARRRPPEDMRKLVQQYNPEKRVEDLSDEEFCAAHLATLCESALQQMVLLSPPQGAAVEYEGLVDKLITDVFPNHFTMDIDEAARQRILDVSKIYSKSGGRDKDWEDDSKRKDTDSTPEIARASEQYLTKSYRELKKHCQYNRDWHYVYT